MCAVHWAVQRHDTRALQVLYAYTLVYSPHTHNTRIHTHTYTHTHIYTHTYTHAHIHTYAHTHTYAHIHICTYTHTYLHTYTHTHTYTYTHTHLHLHTHTHIHTYTHIHTSAMIIHTSSQVLINYESSQCKDHRGRTVMHLAAEQVSWLCC